VLFTLPNRPEDAKFLAADEKQWLLTTLAAERNLLPPRKHGNLLKMLFSPRVLLFCLAYYGLTNLNGAISTFLPSIVSETGLSHIQTGFVTIIPYVFGLAGILLLGKLSDRPGSRLLANYLALFISMFGLLGAGYFSEPLVRMTFLCGAAFGFFGAMPVFWSLPSQFLSASVAAGGIAMINSLGNLSSVINPWIIGTIRDKTGNYNAGFFWLAAMALLSVLTLTLIVRLWKTPSQRDESPNAEKLKSPKGVC
jgi:cyanate permease